MISKTAKTAAILSLLLSGISLAKAPNAPSDEVLSLPLFEGKKVIAHSMTNLIHSREMKAFDANGTRDWYMPESVPGIGGMYIYASLPALMDMDMPLEEAVEYDIKAALQAGIDGFQLYYPIWASDEFLDRLDKIVRAYHRVIEKHGYDFEIALCLSKPWRKGVEQEEMEELIIDRFNELFEDVDKETKQDAWMRTPDGRMLMWTWLPTRIYREEITNEQRDDKAYAEAYNKRAVDSAAKSYYKINKAVGEDIAYVYQAEYNDSAAEINAVFDNFPGAWSWVLQLDDHEEQDKIDRLAKERKRHFGQTIFSDYYTSKMYPKEGGRPFLWLHQVTDKDPKNLRREAISRLVTKRVRANIDRAIKNDVDVIHVATWNDYPEGQHFGPDINHNFAFAEMLKSYKDKWIAGSDIPSEEKAIVFYKKYPLDAVPKFNVSTFYKGESDKGIEYEDNVEVFTALKQPAEIYYNGELVGTAKQGLNTLATPMKIGKVEIVVKRDGKELFKLDPVMKITDKPYRSDRSTVGFSSKYYQNFKELFGDKRIGKVLDSDGTLVEAN